MTMTIQEAAQKRAARAEGAADGVERRAAPPDEVAQLRRSAPLPAQMRAERATKGGKSFLKITGYATVYERGYQMWDWAGPYTEIVSAGAGKDTLASTPNVVYQVNHGGWPFARTTAGTLDLAEDATGLENVAWLNPERTDAQNLYQAVEDGSINEMSFMFGITSGQWSPDYTEYRINAYDLERGDVSPVTYGANPHTSIEARAAQFELRAEVMRALRTLDGESLAAARGVLAEQLGDTTRSAPAAGVVGAKAAEGLRHLRACVVQGALDVRARTEVAVVLQRAAEGNLAAALAGAGPLSVLLGVTVEEPQQREVSGFTPARLDFIETELGVVRELTL